MSSVQYTAGPWRTSKRDPRVICNGGGDKWIGKALTGGGKRGHSPRFLKDAEQAEANARLIAAAPEMLDALKMFESADDFGSMQSAFQAGRKAIAKAEGRS